MKSKKFPKLKKGIDLPPYGSLILTVTEENTYEMLHSNGQEREDEKGGIVTHEDQRSGTTGWHHKEEYPLL